MPGGREAAQEEEGEEPTWNPCINRKRDEGGKGGMTCERLQRIADLTSGRIEIGCADAERSVESGLGLWGLAFRDGGGGKWVAASWPLE